MSPLDRASVKALSFMLCVIFVFVVCAVAFFWRERHSPLHQHNIIIVGDDGSSSEASVVVMV